MPPHRRKRIPPIDDWEPLQRLTTSAEQRTYELIRPVVLFGQSPAERARETGAPRMREGRNDHATVTEEPDGAKGARPVLEGESGRRLPG